MRNRVFYTAAFTDLYGTRFNEGLRLCVSYFDKKQSSSICDYKELQEIICKELKLSDKLCVRKLVNQLVKIGFLKPLMKGYNVEAKVFISSNLDQKKLTLSKVFYKYGNLANTMLSESVNWNGWGAFVFKTIEENKKLTDNMIAGLYFFDYGSKNLNYLSSCDLTEFSTEVIKEHPRYLHQIMSFKSFLTKLYGIERQNGIIYNNLTFTYNQIFYEP